MVPPEEILLRGQALAAGQAAEAWKSAHVEAEKLAHLEGMLALLTPYAAPMEEELARYGERLFSGQIPDVERTGEALRDLLGHMVAAFELFADSVKAFEAAGYAVTGSVAFRGALATLRRLANDVKLNWPHFDDATMDRAIEQGNRGEFADLTDIYNEFPELQKPSEP